MNCQICQKPSAIVHVTEVSTQLDASGKVQCHPAGEKHFCAECAKTLDLPFTPKAFKSPIDIGKLLYQSAKQAHKQASLRCPDCGMTLAEFRNKGRLGSAKDYEIFWEHLVPLLHRVHNSAEHKGRLPGQDEHAAKRKRHLTELRSQLEAAIREEAYEDAAQLRDEIEALQTEPEA